MSLLKLVQFELKKLFRQKLAYIGLIIIILVSSLHFFLNYMNRPAEAYSGFAMIMDSLYIHNSFLFTLPVIAVLLAVFSLCEEFSTGTLRTLMTRPVKRENIVISKFLALFIYMALAFYVLMAISFLFGLRWGYSEDFASSVPRLLFIYFEYILGTMVLVAFTFIVAAFGLHPVSTALISLGFHKLSLLLELFSPIQKYYYSYHITNLAQSLMASSLDYRQIYQSLAIILIYILAFLLIATTVLEKKDIKA